MTASLLLGPLLRYCDETSATVWVHTTEPCTVEILGRSARTFRVHDRHYALVVIEGLQPGTATEYSVELDGRHVWPDPSLGVPPSVIRTHGPGKPVRMIVGSCRASAPHEAPFTLEKALDPEGRGVDSLWAHALRLLQLGPDQWPDLLLLVGDQVYADDSSPRARERIETLRPADSDLPVEIVANYEEYAWLYQEAWSAAVERWLLSTVPSAMIFDDHDVIDDWNISASWVEETRQLPWWEDHILGGMASYLVYQHLGNLSPDQLRAEEWLERLGAVDDATPIVRRWALDSESATPLPGGYRFSYARTLGDVSVIVVDCRNARVLTGDVRRMIGEEETAWLGATLADAQPHVVVATSLPVYLPDGLHDLHVWNEAVCDGAWGSRARTFGERMRRALDLEDWPAYSASFRELSELLAQTAARPTTRSVVVASGDIHFSYAAPVPTGEGSAVVWQVVSSPMRNALIPPERGVLRFSLSRVGAALGSLLRRSVRRPDTRPGIRFAVGPFFANNICKLHYTDETLELGVEHYEPGPDGQPQLTELAQARLWPPDSQAHEAGRVVRSSTRAVTDRAGHPGP